MKRSLPVLAGVCTSLAATLATLGRRSPLQRCIELYQPQVQVWQDNRIEGRGFCCRGEERQVQRRQRLPHDQSGGWKQHSANDW